MVFVVARLLHVAFAMWFVAGLVGRTYTFSEARKSANLPIVARLCKLGGGFDRYFVIPGSQAVLVLGLVTAWLGGYPLFGFLQGATANWLLISLVLFGVLLALVPTVFIPSGKAFDAALQQAVTVGRVTSELTIALNDRRVAWAHRTEFALVAAIVVLMVVKPF